MHDPVLESTLIDRSDSQRLRRRTYLVHDSSLLLQCHGNRILVTVTVQTDLMTSICDHTAFLWKRLERVARNEPGRLDVVSLEHLQKPTNTDRSSE